MVEKKILYVRSGPYVLNFDNYNLQEVGLGAAFCKKGYDFDIVYYSKKDNTQMIKIGKNKITILWRKGIRLLRTGIYPFLLNSNFLKQYDIIIMSEYSQIMSYLVAKKHPNVYLYNGPYYNLFKLPFVEIFYDKLFCKKINRLMKKTFCKTKMAAEFIAKKGITNTLVTGVGLDISKFEKEKSVEENTQKLLDKMCAHRNFLYVGSITPRKNVELIVKAFVQLKIKNEDYKDVQLVIVGKGDLKYIQKCRDLIPKDIENSIVWYSFVKNAQLKFVYKAADIFLLPSVQEIFGMVLLEAMYFSLPVISSNSAGAETLIKNEENGIILENFLVDSWAEKMNYILDNYEVAMQYGEEAKQTIEREFLWDKVAEKMINVIEKM